MKFKKIVLVTLLLLAILTIGTVSATQDTDLNDTLAVDETGDVVEVSPDNDFLCNDELNNTRDVLSESQEDIVGIGIYDADDFEITYQPSWVSFDDVDSKEILNLNVPNDLDDGTLELTITNGDGDFEVYSLDFPDDGNEITCVLADFDLIDSGGMYDLSLKFISQYQELEIDTWTLQATDLKYAFYSDGKFDYITLDYPWNFMIINGLNVWVDFLEIYVGQNQNPLKFRMDKGYYTLEDLGIDSVGIYNISIKSFDNDDLVEEFNFSLDVRELDTSQFRAYMDFGPNSLRFDESIISIYCPDNANGTIVFEYVDNIEIPIDSEMKGQWTDFKAKDLNIDGPSEHELFIKNVNEDSVEDYFVRDYWLELGSLYNANVWDYNENGPFFTDKPSNVIEVYSYDYEEGISARFSIFVNDVCIINDTIDDYRPFKKYDLNDLNITESGDYNITVKIFDEDDNLYRVDEGTLSVVDAKNSHLFGAVNSEEKRILTFFCPSDASGNVTILSWGYSDDTGTVFISNITFEINDTHRGKWLNWTYKNLGLREMWRNAMPDELLGSYEYYEDPGVPEGLVYTIEITVTNGDDEISVPVQNEYYTEDYIDFNFYEAQLSSDEILKMSFSKLINIDNVTISFSNGNYTFCKNLTEFMCCWQGDGYQYDITLGDMDFLYNFTDGEIIEFNITCDGVTERSIILIIKNDGESIGLSETEEENVDGGIQYYDCGNVELNADTEIIFIKIPDSLNITDGEILITAKDNTLLSKRLSELTPNYSSLLLGNIYSISFGDLNLDNVVASRNYLNVSLISDGKIIYSDSSLIYYINEEGNYDFAVMYPEFMEKGNGVESSIANSNTKGFEFIAAFLISDIYETIDYVISCGDKVLFNKTLQELDKKENYTNPLGEAYTIPMSAINFDELSNEDILRFSIFYKGEEISVDEVVVIKNETDVVLIKIFTVENILANTHVDVNESTLVDVANNAITLDCLTNRQAMYSDTGGGHFTVYVNGVKVENLGYLLNADGEPSVDLDVYYLTENGNFKLTLNNLNITENGVYNIRVTHTPDYEYQIAPGDDIFYFGLRDKFYYGITEMEVANVNITLTSNVRTNYQNETAELLTGYGLNPSLLYLDTYYDEIDDVTGRITVYNENGDEIFTSDISDLPLNNGRRYLSYDDFVDDFTDNVTVSYTDGNQRSGNTTLKVLWRNVTSDDFSPVVKNDTVDDYYGNFVSLDISDGVTTGQIIVTVQFKNNHGSNISNMNVTTNFGSRAIYKFNVDDIRANYGNDFTLALSDLGFYEIDGEYELSVQFTADGVNILNITNNALDVKFLDDILLSINETSRYANELPFASVRVFEPISAYGELYIDGVLYSHKSFEKGMIIFDSSASWTPGIHTAELKVCDSEFGSVLNSTTQTFETLIHTQDVEVTMNDTVKENENVLVSILVPKEGVAIIRIDDGNEIAYVLTEGDNILDLGVLPYGNHTIWFAYDATLDNGSASFYYNYLSLFVGDDGHWLNLPEPLVLDNDDTIEMEFGKDATGYVLIYIDGVLVANITLVNGSADFSLTDFVFGDNKYGPHTYEIIYSGDATHDSLSKSGVFNVTYLFSDNIEKEGSPLREFYPIVITLPADATGTVTIVINGKTYTAEVKDGKATFEIYGLDIGEYEVIISYSGDDKYPASSYTKILNVTYYGVVGQYDDARKYVSLMLPTNAIGNLTVYNDKNGNKLYSKALVNGKATIDLTALTVGSYALRAIYEGSDYDVKEFRTNCIVMPKIYITQDIVVGETGQILVDLDDSTGHLLILVNGLEPVLKEIIDGKVNYTFSTEGLSKGDNSVRFQYFGDSFDKSILLDDDNLPIVFNMHLLPKDPNVNMTAGDEYVIIDCGNATGTIEVFVDGVKTDVVSIVNGIAMVDLSQYKNGNYNFTFRYSGDSMYDGVTKDMVVNVYHKVPKITAGNMNVLYSANKKYSVTVYTKDGKLAKNTDVVFLINGKKYGSAKTNAKGVASIVIKSNPGSYKITTNALNVSVTKTLKVTHVLSLKKVAVKRSARNLVLTATLKKVNGKYLKNKKVTFKFNGKAYTAKTNKKGVAKVTITSNVLKKLKAGKKVTYQATYLKDTVKYTVKINK